MASRDRVLGTQRMDDEQCMRTIAKGGRPGEAALAELFTRYYRKLLANLLARRVPRSDAEDLVQDVFVNVVTALRKSAADITNAKAYLYRALHNRLIDHYRLKQPIREADFAQDNPGDLSLIERMAAAEGLTVLLEEPDLFECFQGVLDAFFQEDHDAASVIAMAVEGFTGEEMASVLGRTHGATREFLRQCRRKFQSLLKEHCRDFLPQKLIMA